MARVLHFAQYGCASRPARDPRVPGVQDAGRARQGRRGAALQECRRVYPIRDDIPIMLPEEATRRELAVGVGALERAQLGLLAAIAATCLVSIFAAQLLLAFALVRLRRARLVRGEARVRQRSPLGRLPCSRSASGRCCRPPSRPTRCLARERQEAGAVRPRLPGGGRAVAARARASACSTPDCWAGWCSPSGRCCSSTSWASTRLDNRPRSFLGHYMTASGLSMAVLVLAARAARASGARRSRAPTRDDLRRAARALGAVRWLTLALAGASTSSRSRASGCSSPRSPAAAALLALSRAALAAPPPRARCWRARGPPLCAWALLVSRTRNAWLGALVGLGAGGGAAGAAPAAGSLPGGRRAGARAAAGAGDRPPDAQRREQPRPLLHVAGRRRHDPRQARLRPGARDGRRRLPALPLAGGAEPAPRRTCTTTPSRSPPSAGCPAWPGGSGWVAAACATPGAAARRAALRAARPAAAALGGVGRGDGAGLFEYNFGDSEILMFTLLVVGAALRAAPRDRAATAAGMSPRPARAARAPAASHARPARAGRWAT